MAGELMLGGIVLLGSCVQWLTGMGFALVAVPALVLLLGPAEGVVLANCAAGAISVVGLASGWRRVRPRAMVPLCAAAALTVPHGQLAGSTAAPARAVGVHGCAGDDGRGRGHAGHPAAALRGTRGAVAAGAAGGFMNSAAGVGGPPVSLYALNAGWTVREFVPNAQFYGVVVNTFSVAANGFPHLGPPRWALVVTGMAVGATIGSVLAGRVPERRARALVLVLALTGGVTTLGKGLWGW